MRRPPLGTGSKRYPVTAGRLRKLLASAHPDAQFVISSPWGWVERAELDVTAPGMGSKPIVRLVLRGDGT